MLRKAFSLLVLTFFSFVTLQANEETIPSKPKTQVLEKEDSQKDEMAELASCCCKKKKPSDEEVLLSVVGKNKRGPRTKKEPATSLAQKEDEKEETVLAQEQKEKEVEALLACNKCQ